jgi:subtilisin-like proprotein convertase family protein
MKTRILIGLLAAAWGTTQVQAAFIESDSPNQMIPEGNPVGVVFTTSVTDIPAGNIVSGLTVGFNVSGGYNGSMYAYLVSPNGTKVTLLNQPGVTGSNPFGYGGSGFDVTFSDAGTGNIQTTPETPGTVLTGVYQPVDSLSGVNGSLADGTWTLYFADLVLGGGSPTLNNVTWDITVTPTGVPDSGNTLMLLSGGLATLAYFKRRFFPPV